MKKENSEKMDFDFGVVRIVQWNPDKKIIPDIAMEILYPGKSESKMYGTEPRYNDLRCNDNPDVTSIPFEWNHNNVGTCCV